MKMHELGFGPLDHETALWTQPVTLRLLVWSHQDCTLTLTNLRLLFWDREDDDRSCAWDAPALAIAAPTLAYDSDLLLTTPDGRRLHLGLSPGERAQLLRLLQQHFDLTAP
jgi:hypothetical protein